MVDAKERGKAISTGIDEEARLAIISVVGIGVCAVSLRSLETLFARHLESLTALPESFGQLSKLTHLDLSLGFSLSSLPRSFGRLCSLQSLDIAECALTELPASFIQLSELVTLNLADCHNMPALPESIGLMPNGSPLRSGPLRMPSCPHAFSCLSIACSDAVPTCPR